MRYTADQKIEARKRLLAAAGRAFRRQGYGGIGVDGLAKEAGVTSGAFYGHFKSKEAAFGEALAEGVDQLLAGITALRAEHGADWVRAFVDFYLGERRTCELDNSCALQSLTPEVQRADVAMRQSFEGRTLEVVTAIADGLQGDADVRVSKAWSLLSILTGAVTLARAVADPKTSEQIAMSARTAALGIAI